MNQDVKRVFCVISHTHWDREWYMPLENFRHRLVDLMDRLLVILEEQPSYIFHLDAQTVVLEDYLAVRPEKRAILKKYIARRRLMIGPFYLQNDFYLASGESTVRNLLEGQKLCREFGGCAKAGYAADQFGNISQLPQILREFGLDNFVFGRGFSQIVTAPDGTRTPKRTPTEFVWQGADGSRVLAIHMRHWYNNAQRFSADIDKALRYLRAIENNYKDEFTATPYLLLMNGVDHLEAQPDIRAVTDAMQQRLDNGEYVLQYNMDDYVEAVASYINDKNIPLQTVRGEMRSDHGITILQGTLSSRPYLKSANVEAQILLENRLEPLYAMMERMGMHGVYPHDRLVYTWKNLIRNHPHDSICGCSHDAVHAHMENRYAEIFEFAEEQLRRGLDAAAQHTATVRKASMDDYLITVANTLSVPLSGTVETELMIRCVDEKEAFRILDGEGQPVPFVVTSKEHVQHNVFPAFNLPGKVDVWKYTLQLDAGEVAPYAFKTFLVTAGDEQPTLATVDAHQPTVIENEVLTVAVTADGRVDVTDRRTGRTLPNCLRLEDAADAGESYMFLPAGDTPLYSDDWQKEVTLTAKTALKQTITITYTMELPEGYCPESKTRTAQMVTNTLALQLTLYRGRPFVEMAYTLDNASKDHRLRLCVDSDIAPAVSYADSAFDVVCRTAESHFPTTPAKIDPNASFAALVEEGRGVAVFTAGQHAYEHPEQHPERLAFTLVRATGKINLDSTENWVVPGNQCLRRLTGRMALCPFTGDLVSADIPNVALTFRAPLVAWGTACDHHKFESGRPCVQDTALTEFFYVPDTHPEVAMPDNASAITVDGRGVTVSAFKLCEDESGLIVRLYNYSEEETTATVTAKGHLYRTHMDEIARAFLGNDRATLTLRPKEIVTLCLQDT